MIKLSRELKTGLIALVAIAMLIWGFNYLKGQNILSKSTAVYYVMFDNVEGLDESSDVTVNGHTVGSVLDIEFDGKSEGGLRVSFNITEDFEFSRNSRIIMYSASMLGSKDLKIIPAYDGDIAPEGYLMQGEIEEDLVTALTNRIAPIEENLNETLANMNETFIRINDVLGEDTRQDLKSSMTALRKTLTQLEDMTSETSDLAVVLENTASLTSELNEFSAGLNELNLDSLNIKLDQSLTEINTLVTQINSGEGTVGKLMYDQQLYDNLTDATKELELLLNEINENPKRFVHFSIFGKKDKSKTEE